MMARRFSVGGAISLLLALLLAACANPLLQRPSSGSASSTGSLGVNVTWSGYQISSPSIQATFTPATGSPVPITMTISGNTASTLGATVPSGAGTITLLLQQSGTTVAGAVSVTKVTTGQTTPLNFSFSAASQATTGAIKVNMTPSLANPIPVSISGAPFTLMAGTSLTASASVSDGTANVIYVWYLNGASIGTGAGFTFGNTLAYGTYRLDVTAFSSDGTRGGSTTTTFQVGAATSKALLPAWADTLTAGTPQAYFKGVAVDSSGNVYAAGYMNGTGTYGFGNGVSATGTATSYNVLLVKYNSSGVAQWARTLTAGTEYAIFSGVAVDSSGNIYAAGVTDGNGTDGFGNGVTATGNANDSLLLVKYNSSGVAQWAQALAAEQTTNLTTVAVDNSGNVYVAGNCGAGTFEFGNGVTATNVSGGVLLVKYNSSGAAQWVQTMTGGTGTFYSSLAVDSTGDVYAGGYANQPGTFNFGNGVTATGPGTFGNVLLVKYNSSGVAQWAQTQNEGTEAFIFGVAVDSSENVYAAGWSSGTGTYGFSNGVTETGTAGSNVLLLKYSPSGAAQWAQTLTGTAGGEFNGLTVDGANNIDAVGFMAGGTSGFGNGVSATGAFTGANVLLVKYNTSGAAQQAETLTKGTNNAYFYGVAVDSSDNIYAAGNSSGTSIYGFGNGVTATGTGSNENVLLVNY